MWHAPLLIGSVILALGLGIALFADQVSAWRARIYGEPAPPPVIVAMRGGVLVVIGLVVVVIAFARL